MKRKIKIMQEIKQRKNKTKIGVLGTVLNSQGPQKNTLQKTEWTQNKDENAPTRLHQQDQNREQTEQT
ncbi:hypothetical protein FACS189472_14800 [Alphaproteobacteria bacterium]|nr:hypothetical protein FACS189472_14800 [Alphaproteobacteria bacterium]